jgi:hypothetical protein
MVSIAGQPCLAYAASPGSGSATVDRCGTRLAEDYLTTAWLGFVVRNGGTELRGWMIQVEPGYKGDVVRLRGACR